MVEIFYVDTCVLISYYFEHGTQKYTDVINCFEFINKNPGKISLVTSDFTFLEFVKVATNNPFRISRDIVFEIIQSIMRRKKIGTVCHCDIINGEGSKSDYHLSDFFVELQEQLLNSNVHLADTIHYQIMANNNVKRVLTLNIKDFKKFQEILPIHPSKIIEYFIKPPISSFTTDKHIFRAPGVVTFTDTSLNLPTSWQWNFGDGTTSDIQNPVHRYSRRGLFSVTLQVTNEAGTDISDKRISSLV